MKKKFPYIYYFILMLLMLFGTSSVESSLIVRFLFALAIFLPIIFVYRTMLPICLVSFYTMATLGVTYGLLPYSIVFYVIIMVIGILINLKNVKKTEISYFNITVILFLLYVMCIDMIDSGLFTSFATMLLFLLLFNLYNPNFTEKTYYYFLFGFCLVSIFFSCVYFINYKAFLVSYSYDSGLERSGWMDVNYLSCMIGMGEISAILMLFKLKKNVLLKFFYIIVIMVSFIAQVMMASRGGLVATLGSMLLLLLLVKIKLRYKVLGIILASLFIIVLYTNNYFELLQYRLENDTGGGSGRVDIWMAKLNIFFQSDIIHFLFGYGFWGGMRLDFNNIVAFHNDFIGILCCYGIIGLSLFLFLLFYPLKIALKSNRPCVLILLIYLILCMCTLEPFLTGFLLFIGFYFFILALAQSKISIFK